MKAALDTELCQKFPTLYRDRNADMRTTCMCWGFSCGDGWAGILSALSAGITNATSERCWGGKAKAADGHFECGFVAVAEQVKEKYGTLRFYWRAEPKPGVPPEAVDEEYAQEIRGRIDGLVEMAERMSAITCEVCGAPGKLNRGGWLEVRCDRCRLEDQAYYRRPRWWPRRWVKAWCRLYAWWKARPEPEPEEDA